MKKKRNQLIARLRALNYHIARYSDYIKQPVLEKLLAEIEQIKKALNNE